MDKKKQEEIDNFIKHLFDKQNKPLITEVTTKKITPLNPDAQEFVLDEVEQALQKLNDEQTEEDEELGNKVDDYNIGDNELLPVPNNDKMENAFNIIHKYENKINENDFMMTDEFPQLQGQLVGQYSINYFWAVVYKYLHYDKLNYDNNLLEFLNESKKLFSDCMKNSWVDFIKQVGFVEYTWNVSNTKDKFYIYPQETEPYYQEHYNYPKYMDDIMFTKFNKPDKILRKNREPLLMYDFRNDFLAIQYPDLMMFDYDFKEDTDYSEEQILEKLDSLVDLSATYDKPYVFLLFKTDRGIHTFVVNKPHPHKELYSSELMLNVCNDTFYTAFTHRFGYCVRLNPKEATPDDFIAQLGSSIKQKQLDELTKYYVGLDEMIDNRVDEDFKTKNKFEFESKFWGENGNTKTFTLFYFNLEDIDDDGYLKLQSGIKIQVLIGNKEHIDKNLWKCAMEHYIFIQYFRDVKKNKSSDLRRSIGNISLDLDTTLVNDMRDDVNYIMNKTNELFKGTHCEDDEDCSYEPYDTVCNKEKNRCSVPEMDITRFRENRFTQRF